jgi:chemotaxis family two-component system response regulator Rcp1
VTPDVPAACGRDLLIVDDDLEQAKLFEVLLAELGRGHRCHHAGSGAAALRFLRLEAPHENAPRPDLIILDVNMPEQDGCDTLQTIKSDPNLRSIPVIMFSASLHETDILRCYTQHANAYVQKPVDLEAGLSVVRQIEAFWFHTVQLPA